MSTVRPKPQIPQLRARPSTTPTPSTGPGSAFSKRRAFIYAGGFAVITIAGTLIGATLKTRMQEREKEAAKTKTEEKLVVDVDGQIKLLEETRTNLLQRKGQLERKINEVRERSVKEEELRVQREELRRKGDEIKRQMALQRSAERG